MKRSKITSCENTRQNIKKYKNSEFQGNYPCPPTTYLFELNWTDRYENQSENKIWLIFLLLKNNIKIIQERMVFEMKIIKQELEFEECLRVYM